MTSPLLARRLANAGAASILFYNQPLELVRGQGAWLEAADGTLYLDAYNNVPSVGHCHPKVVAAIAEQTAKLAIHSRYLHEIVESYLERLKASFPSDLANIVLCCTASEANDLAMRIAMRATGRRGFIITENAYHGSTLATIDISPALWKRGSPLAYVRLVPPPSRRAYGDDITGGFTAAVAQAAAALEADGLGLAAFICDSIFSSDGVLTDPPGFLGPVVETVRAAGGLYIADEVQSGFGRTGAGMWGFQRHGVQPDMVTMGKAMGNGYPVAGLAVRPELLSQLCEDIVYFNTYAGNPVAAAAGLAVLDVIEQEKLIDNAAHQGAVLLAGIRDIVAGNPLISEVRGAGFFIGVEFAGVGAPARVKAIVEGLRQRRVLIGTTGRYGESLKIRPPLCFSDKEVAIFLEAFAEALAEVTAAPDGPGTGPVHD
ncbi:MAG: aminotransferase class III-fold pyridoxal phosphate-dependent enzyme [Gloeomargarita sp. SKYG116]|nr:aminotransferase class III-fold pyridoxal phosphate-dependent enzyme [Gloeomargarita sp. SKYG116]MDW8401177.1 aminotransferase class III-fold pyridoxal phosphate-dependent enzyme [Gloeomargarita sp. SKYGB_i_bin116]